MKLEFLNNFADPYMQTAAGRGVFLAGVVLGMVAQGQSKDGNLEGTPLFKQMTFGRMKGRDLKRHLARVPELVKAYDIKYKDIIRKLAAYAGELILQEKSFELGVDGNFAFATGFINAREYFWAIFSKQQTDQITN
ncbi:TM1802 family CRISPR-associated protein [Desulforamulus ferrireducens]|uniref:CRISPR-associated protein n=1 Tax=Desulforamulus ferrireducens TaxID=1833852 RepID=A0A1S6IUE1_9FIRM|nr:TM1802 family CRISPR-associated protein [Desulforamulus ferrireducens]AQS58402.1 CRISPR-associated protein [Desulforamulus ferrireducens]